MSDDDRKQEALFRYAILGEALSRRLRRGELREILAKLSEKTHEDHQGRLRRTAYKTLEEWWYKYRQGGFAALQPQPRSDQGRSRRLTPDLEQLVLGTPPSAYGCQNPPLHGVREIRSYRPHGSIAKGSVPFSPPPLIPLLP